MGTSTSQQSTAAEKKGVIDTHTVIFSLFTDGHWSVVTLRSNLNGFQRPWNERHQNLAHHPQIGKAMRKSDHLEL
jgi:hypothetical protein